VDATANLSLPYIMPAQAQKHITHNEALLRLDALVQLSVIDRNEETPPGAPAEGDRYLVASGATGAWSGWDESIAVFASGAWARLVPKPGWLCWVEDEAALLVRDADSWDELDAGGGSGGPPAESGNSRTVLVNAIRTAKALGAQQFLPDGWVDGFGGNDGIDEGESSGYVLDTDEMTVQVGAPTEEEQEVSGATGASFRIGLDQNAAVSAIFDGTTSKGLASCSYGAANAADGSAGKDYGSGTEKRIAKVVCYGSNDKGFNTGASNLDSMTLTLRAKNGAAPATDTEGTSLGTITFTNTDDESAGRTITSSDSETAYRHVWVHVHNNGTATGNRPLLAQLVFSEIAIAAPDDAVIQSIVKEADDEPDELTVTCEIEPIDAIALGTDMTIKGSRDGGTTFTGGTPIQVHSLGSRRLVEAVIDVSGQPAGDEVCSRIEFFNDKAAKLTGIAESWGA
jgi:hypothetical protein